ncbi:MAG: DUF1850 domain-containing protein [Lysinibacillus sp.]|nr:DUF1850 domain-containing protein [Lysinibacillus sp.]
MKKMSIGIALTFAIVCITIFLPLFQVISFTETKTNNPQIYYIDVGKDKRFQIRFTHSIHLTDVLETYEVLDNKFKIISMEYEEVAVGMPAYAEEGQRLTYNDGKYILYYEDSYLENFILYVGDINMDLFFYYSEKQYDLKKSLQRGSSYKIEVQNFSLYDKMKGVRIAHEE